jgi:ferrous-iron efflux pump FieF
MSTADATDLRLRPHEEAEARLKNQAARLSIIAAAALIVIKTAAGWMTGSISVWASLLDSTMDVFASTINYFAVRAASRPPDREHHYGHGKAESLAGLAQAAVICASGLLLIREAVRRLLTPHETADEWLGVATMLTAALVSVFLVMRLRRVARRTESPALAADAVHYASDVYTNGAALIALLVVALTGWRLADPLVSIAISGYIVWSAVSVGRDAVDVLMDKRLPREVDETIARVVRGFEPEGAVDFHDLRTRRSGSVKFIDFHLSVRRDLTFVAAHDLTVRVLRAVEAAIPRSRVQIHTDPAD